MDKELFFEQMERLDLLFPNWKVDITDEQTMRVWYSELKHLSDKEFEQNVDDYIKTNSYPPTVAGLLNPKNNGKEVKARINIEDYDI